MSKVWSRFVPRSVAAWCVVAIGAGLLAGWIFGPACAVLDPVGQIFIRAYSLVILPYLMLEVTGTLGGMSRGSMILLLKRGGLALAGMVLVAGGAVVLLPQMLPPLLSSPIFDPQTLAEPVPEDFLATILPSNIFSALVSGNIAGVLVFSIALGVLLQTLPGREAVLGVLLPMRALFTAALGVVAKRIAPFGIFAITAVSFGAASGSEFQRLLGFAAMMLTAFVSIGCVFLPGLVLCLTRFPLRRVWWVLRDPVILSVTIGNLLVALPLIVENLRRLFEETGGEDDDGADFAILEALAPLSLLLFSIGRMMVMSFLPFAAWYHDTPMRIGEILWMLPRVLISSAAGANVVLLQELPKAGLPQSLIALYLMNAQWIVRLSDLISLSSLACVAFIVLASLRGNLVFRPVRFGLLLAATVAVGVSMGWGANHLLAATLQGSSNAREIVLSRGSFFETPTTPVFFKTGIPEPDGTSIAEIRRRGILRAGVSEDAAPWAYRNASGDLVGYDLDLLAALAARLEVALEIHASDRRTLREWLSQGRLDVVAGGVHDTGIPVGAGLKAVPYEVVSLAFVVADAQAREFQAVLEGAEKPPLTIDYAGRDYLSSELERSIRARLAASGFKGSPIFHRLEPGQKFPLGRFDLEVLLTSAEAGAAFAVLNPETSMVPVFGNSLAADVCLVFSAENSSLIDFAEEWVRDNRNLDLIENLRTHWILFKNPARRPL